MSARSYVVRLSARATEDLIAVYRWIASEADTSVADAYLDRVEAKIATLATYPKRGTRRDDLSAGLRTIAFERRLLIAYRFREERVDVLRIVNAARDVGSLLKPVE